jgi:Tfp pilus assembly protein PilE
MGDSRGSLAVAIAAVAALIAVTVVHGTWTERWGTKADDSALRASAARLEGHFPKQFGDWKTEQDMETSPEELARAGAVGSVARAFRNARTKAVVSAFVVCALPHDASGHTPDRCYPGAGFEIAEQEHRQNVPLTDGREAETFTGTFRKSDQTLRVFWTYGIPAKPADAKADPTAPADSTELRWVAPQIARIALNGEPYVYKLYVIVDQTKLGSSQATLECTNFLAAVLPAFNTTLAEADTKPDVGPTPPTAAAADGRPG